MKSEIERLAADLEAVRALIARLIRDICTPLFEVEDFTDTSPDVRPE